MSGWEQAGARLSLLIDPDRETARAARPALLERGLELVHARAGVAGLELIQRMRDSFVLVIVSLNLRDLPGAVVIETLRLFRPDLPLVCLTDVDGGGPVYHAAACVSKPIRDLEFKLQLEGALLGTSAPVLLATVDPQAVERARWRYTETSDLLRAAREIARGLTEYTGDPE